MELLTYDHLYDEPKKNVRISSKRQITIPQRFFTQLGFKDEAECILRDDELIIRPIHTTSAGDFDEELLADLISQGLKGQELLAAFKEQRKQIRPAVSRMIAEAKQAAYGKGEYESAEDVFDEEK